MKAAGVKPWDRLIREVRSGLGQALPLTLGSDVSGTVAALGAGVGVFALGDTVYGATNDQFVGGYAEYLQFEKNPGDVFNPRYPQDIQYQPPLKSIYVKKGRVG